MKHIYIYFSFLFITLIASGQPIIYVTPLGGGNHSGISWINALSGNQLASRVAVAPSGTQFWLAAGTYKPTTTTDRTVSFSLSTGVSIYGGFSGSEILLDQRSPNQNATVLSGDIGIEGFSQDNSQHIISLYNTSGSITIDGLTITDGHRISYDYSSSGAGLYADLTNVQLKLSVSNCYFINNIVEGSLTGGGGIGIYAKANSTCDLHLKNCYFTGNFSDNGGAFAPSSVNGTVNSLIEDCIFYKNSSSGIAGAIEYTNISESSSLTIKRCKFFNNSAFYWAGAISTNSCKIESTMFVNNSVTSPVFPYMIGGGGAISGIRSRADFTNCTFTNNSALYGGAIYSYPNNNKTKLYFTNCTFTKNNASISGGVFNNARNPESSPFIPDFVETNLKNCIIWQNTSPDESVYKPHIWISFEGDQIKSVLRATYSLIQGGYNGTGIINTDPLFVDAENGNFRLRSNSPAINAGDPNTTGLPITDLSGNTRIQGGHVDLGAYESNQCQTIACIPLVIQRKTK
jgi:predicted outer membrane repeat protein